MNELLVFLALVGLFVVGGVAVGMLVARWLARWTDRDEEPDDD